MTRMDLTPPEQHLLLSMTRDQRLRHLGLASENFKLSHENLGTPEGDLQFSPILVDWMVWRGLLTVLQATHAVAKNPYRRPFCVALSKEGTFQRDQLVKDRITPKVRIDEEGFAWEL